MIAFKNLALQYLPNDAHCGFFRDATKKLAEAGSDVKNAVKPLDAELDRLYAMEADNMYRLRKSNITAAIAAANRRLSRSSHTPAMPVRPSRKCLSSPKTAASGWNSAKTSPSPAKTMSMPVPLPASFAEQALIRERKSLPSSSAETKYN